MTSETLNRQAAGLVRRYSADVEGRMAPYDSAYRLSMAVVEDRPNLEILASPWAIFHRPEIMAESKRREITAVIASESEALRDTWTNFQKLCDPADRLDLEAMDSSMEGILELVRRGIQNRNEDRKSGRHGAVSRRFHKFCGAVDSHKSLLKVLPESSEYFSLFTGSVTAVVQASVNHETVIETLSKALGDMTDIIKDSERDLMLFPDDDMTIRVVDLYTAIFRFLGGSLKWMMKSRRSRAGDAFNENLAELFERDIGAVKAKSQRIRLYATQSGLADGRATRHLVDGIDKEVRQLRQENSQMALRMEEMTSAHRQLAEILRNQLLLPQATFWISEQRYMPGAQHIPLPWRSVSPSVLEIDTTTEATADRTEDRLRDAADALEGYFDNDRVKLAPEGFLVSSIPFQMLERLIDWLSEPVGGASFLWLQGAMTMVEDHENPMSMLAAMFVEIAGEIEIRDKTPTPLISYFCNTSRRRPREGNPTREGEGSVGLAYALLRQLLTHLSRFRIAGPALDGAVSSLEVQVRRLDGTTRTWSEMLGALREAAAAVPTGILCVIDGLHWVDDDSTEGLLRGLIQHLRGSKMKVLFTTTARSGALLMELAPEEIVRVD
ncbi:uncharacterized protein DNG_09719 [Cephalotrichum gorgonifer]|uniref:DUF7708 domain-containing protein n=1 Tax=Cephalotrichum gorgonifer TaxID=2041049 RepID=A0AAE8N681_9PEZI|nr:uncharacterized protein DNG_09719 [Cephalotrichum gorgonifer]